MTFSIARLAPAAALCLPLLVSAQTTRPDPADPKAPAPALRHASAFADYKPWQDIKPGDWRSANDSLRDAAAQSGGHAGHGQPAAPAVVPAHQASAPAPKASAPSHKASGPMMHKHHTHPMHGGPR